MREFFILTFIVLIISTHSCPTNYQISHLQAGSAIFQTTQKKSQITIATYNHLFQVIFSGIPTVAYSIHNIIINNNITYQWSISTHSITNNKLSIRFKYLPLQWILIKCGFLVGSRKDIILGSIASNFQSLKQNSVFITVDFSESIPNYTSSILRVFLSGFTMKSGGQYFIRAFDKSIGQKKVQIGIQVGGTMQITEIQLNYIIFNPRMLNFASYGGGQNQILLNQSKIYHIEKNIYNSDYKIYGIGHMRHSGQNSIAFLCEIDNQFYLRLDSLKPFQEIFVAYIVLGVTPRQLCQNCNQFTFVNERQCFRQCSVDSYTIRYQDGGKGCRRCPSEYNMILNSTKSGCQCKNGYVKKRGFCVDPKQTSNISPINSLIQKLINIINQKQVLNPFSNFAAPGNFQSSYIQTEKSPTSISEAVSIAKQNNYLPNNLQDASRIVNYNVNAGVNHQMNVAYYGANLATASTQSMNQKVRSNNSVIQATISVGNSNLPISSLENGKEEMVFSNILKPTLIASNPPIIINKKEDPYGNQNNIQNSFIPSIPTQQARTIHQNIIYPHPKTENVSKDCSQFPFTYWTGYRCACKVGYRMNGSICSPTVRGVSFFHNRPAQFVKRLSALILNQPIVSKETYSKHNSEEERKLNIDFMQEKNNIRPSCIDNSRYQDGQCVCLKGFLKINGQCKKKQQPIFCGQYQQMNSSGYCSCISGYKIQGRKCIPIRNKCGPNSFVSVSGNCQCNKGYNLYGKICLLCPPGQISIAGTCQYTCGVNQIPKLHERNITKCICKQNYGRLDGICQLCPTNYFNINGYCVTCPIRTIYNPQSRRCICQKGFILKNGVFCQKLCNNPFQQYCKQTDKCKCLTGFNRVGNLCKECQSGVFDPFTLQCRIGCGNNEIKIGNRCICKPQYGYGPNQLCMRCSDNPGGFLIDGYCAKCPQNQIFLNGKCTCSKNKKLIQNRCVNACSNPSQLADLNGFCFFCPVNEEIVNHKCECKKNYERINNVCVIKCPENSIQINGVCGFCAMNTQYCPIRKACLCPNNYYMNKEGACQTLIPSIQCPSGSYYCKENRKCKPCGKDCKSCQSLQICGQCIGQGFYPSGGVCVSKCGDGIKLQSQFCDDGNSNNFDGCSSNCQIQSLFSCQGTKPSRCTKIKGICGDGILSFDQQCDDRNTDRGDGCFNCLVQSGWRCQSNICQKILISSSQVSTKTPEQSKIATDTDKNLKQVGQAIINVSNVIVVLQCPSAFKFQSDSQMRSFMKYSFFDKSTEPKSVYCMQRSKTPKLFDCLNIYPSGVPTKQFNIKYYYTFEEQKGQKIVHISSLKNIQKKMSRPFK